MFHEKSLLPLTHAKLVMKFNHEAGLGSEILGANTNTFKALCPLLYYRIFTYCSSTTTKNPQSSLHSKKKNYYCCIVIMQVDPYHKGVDCSGWSSSRLPKHTKVSQILACANPNWEDLKRVLILALASKDVPVSTLKRRNLLSCILYLALACSIHIWAF